MGLNFPDFKKDAPKSPTTAANDFPNDLVPTETKSYSEWESERQAAEIAKLFDKSEKESKKDQEFTNRIKRERAERYVMLKMGRQMQNNIITAGRLTEKILLANRDGEPIEVLTLMAVKGLSLLVNDTLLYKTIADRIEKESGFSLDSKPPYEVKRPAADKK